MSEKSVPVTRRQFVTLSGSALAAPLLQRDAQGEQAPWNARAVVKKLYLCNNGGEGWPYPDVDTAKSIAEIDAGMATVEDRNRNQVEFLKGDLLRAGDNAAAWVKGLKDVDAILAFNLSTSIESLIPPILDSGIPMLLFSRPYAGHTWSSFAAWPRMSRKADVLATSEYGDLQPYIGIFRTIAHMRKSKVLVVRPAPNRKLMDGFAKQFGTTIEPYTYEQIKAAYDSTDAGKAQQSAQEFIKGALRIVEPKPAEVTDALRFYFAVLDVLRREKANAITIDCLGGFARGQLPAYPCVAWSKLNDQGLYGVCESDLASTITQLLVTSYSGKPGFVSDPVFDTSRNEVTHAHCVASTAMAGIGGPHSPYIIRSHAEDKKGVSMQVLMPVGQTITLARFADPDKFLVSTADVVDNVDNPNACRTKIRTRVSDARKMLEQYSNGLHRVVFYGDYVRPIEAMGRLMGFQVIREL